MSTNILTPISLQLVKPFGLEADRHLLRCLFSHIDFSDAIQASKNSLQAKLLSQELTALLNKSSLITNICFAIDKSLSCQKVNIFYHLYIESNTNLEYLSISQRLLSRRPASCNRSLRHLAVRLSSK